MIQKLSMPVSVVTVFDHKKRLTVPRKILFEGSEHLVTRVGFHHTQREGRTLYHVFSVASDSMFFRLIYNTETLSWTLEEVDDGEAN